MSDPDWPGRCFGGDLNVCKMTYKMTQHTRRRAKQHGVRVKPSSKKNKKIDVVRDGNVIASVGDERYPDFGTYLTMEAKGQVKKGTADDRRRAYRARHGKYLKGSAGYWAGELLW